MLAPHRSDIGWLGCDQLDYTLSDDTSTDSVSVTTTVCATDNRSSARADAFPAQGGVAINEYAAQASYDVLANDTRDSDTNNL